MNALARVLSVSALKKRAYRRRLRDGVIVLQIEITECDLAEAMIASERLSEVDTLDRGKLAAAVSAVLREWAARWCKRLQTREGR
jgi:hypothetical protein